MFALLGFEILNNPLTTAQKRIFQSGLQSIKT